MGSLFSTPKPPKIPAPIPPPPVPTVDVALQRQTEADRLSRRRGRAANMLTGSSTGAAPTAAKMLLGT